MRVGIDASNTHSGGTLTHIVEFLRAANPSAHGFTQIVVWGGRKTLACIEDRSWLIKCHQPMLDMSLPYRVIWQCSRLSNLARKAGCDVLFVPGGSYSGSFRPVVAMSQNVLLFEWQEIWRYGLRWPILKNVLLRLVQTRTFRRVDGLIFLTQYAQRVVMKVVKRHPGPVSIIPHGIHERFFYTPRICLRTDAFTNEKPVLLLYVSRIEPYKHQGHVVEAVGLLRKAGLSVAIDLVGPSYNKSEMVRLNRILQCIDPEARFVRYRGTVPYEVLHEFYRKADIKIFASSCENMPNILLESMAAGLPIACSNRGPMPEVLGDAGLYFDPEQPNDIARAIRTLIKSPDLRLEKAQAAHERARQFSWTRCADETLEFLSRVCAGSATQ